MPQLLKFYLSVSRGALLSVMAVGVMAGLANAALIVFLNRQISGNTGLSGLPTYALVAVAAVVGGFLSAILVTRFAQLGIVKLRNRLLADVGASSLRTIEQVGPTRLMTAFTDDFAAISRGAEVVPVVIMNVVIVVACLCFIATVSWRLLALTLLIIGTGVVLYRVMSARGAPALAAYRASQEALQRGYENVIFGFKGLKQQHTVRRHFVGAYFATHSAHHEESKNGSTFWFAGAEAVGRLVFFLSLGLIPYLVPLITPGGDTAISGAGMVFTLMYLLSPISAIVAVAPVLYSANVAYEKLLSLGLRPEFEPDRAYASTLPSPDRLCIAFEDVCYRYTTAEGEEGFALGPVSFEVCAGKILFICGGNGSGKSTLAKIICGLYPPTEGRITVNGADVGDRALTAYRELFSATWNDHHLLFDEVTRSRLRPMLQGVNLIEELRLGRILAELRLDHDALSTGQKKRLALLCALSSSARIFVFDEWAANQDPEFRTAFYTRLLPLISRAGYGVVVITHDEQFFDVADEILYMDSGTQLRIDSGSARPAHAVPNSMRPHRVAAGSGKFFDHAISSTI